MSYYDIWLTVILAFDILAVGYIFGKIHQRTKADREGK